MTTPCNADCGCGSTARSGSMPLPAPFTAVDPISFPQMTNFMAPVPGTTNMPTQSGIAATLPQPGAIPTANTDELPEMIPGRPDEPLLPSEIPGIPPVTSTPTPTPLPAPGVRPAPVLPEAPRIPVPPNPLLPPGYQDFIDYENLQYLNGFLRTQIGKYMRVQQLVGSSELEDRYGYLVGVGINYILLQELGTGNILAVDYYGIKSVYIYFNQTLLPMNR